jgi:hypothetical protein
MTQNDHLEDDAELYALGLTDPDRGSAIEAHLAACAECRTRVAEAEETAAALAGALPPMPAARPARWSLAPGLAAAAAVVFAAAAGFEGYTAHTATTQLAHTDTALIAMASSHFGHTTLTSAPGVTAKAIYARDGAWCYVVASGVGEHAHLVMHRDGIARDLGPLSDGRASTLFVTGAGRVSEITIVADGRTLASGRPVY